jgi:opacity protein-like surface antigen
MIGVFMRNVLNQWTIKSALCLGISLAATGIASGQASVTAQRGAEIAPWVQTTYLRPDYGQPNNIGYTVGGDYTRFIRSVVQPSLEIRYTSASGTQVNESSFTGGLKLQTTIYGVHPYATMLAGTGHITFVHPVSANYPGDTSFVYSLGGGLEFNVLPSWKLRADFTDQHWDLDPAILTPMAFSVGVSYSIPFHGGGGWVH